jgi:hypothetical protein
MIKIYLAVLCCITLSQAGFTQSADDYRSRKSGDWNVADTWERFNGSSWQLASTPPSSANGAITIRNNDTVTVSSPTNGDQVLVANGGNLRLQNPLTLNNGPGTDLNVDGTLLMPFGDIIGTGTVLVNGVFTWNGGAVECATTISSSGTLNYNVNFTSVLRNNFMNNGTLNWTAGVFQVQNSTFTNNGLFTITSSANIVDAGAGSFINSSQGSVRKSTPELVQIEIPFQNQGTIDVQQGTLRNNSSSFINSGTINIASNRTFQNIGVIAFNQGTMFTGTGTLQLSASEIINGPVAINQTITTIIDGGEITGTGPLTFNGAVTFTAGRITCTSVIGSTGTLNYNATNNADINAGFTNNGSINWTGGEFRIRTGILVNNGSFNMNGPGSEFVNTGTGSFVNSLSGTVNKTASNLVNIKVPFTNNGTIRVQEGTLRNNNTNFINDATIQIDQGRIFQNISIAAFNTGTSITGGGTLQLSASQLINSPVTVSESVITLFDGGEITGSGPLTFPGTLNWTAGILSCPTTIAGSGTLNYNALNICRVNAAVTNNGTVNWSGGDFTLQSSTFTNNGTFRMQGPGTDLINTGSGNFINSSSGAVRKSASNLVNIRTTFSNAGLIDVQTGVLRNFDTSFNNSGTINVAQGRTFQNSSRITFSAGTTFTGNGTIQLSNVQVLNASITFPQNITVEFDGGEIRGTGELTIAGTFNFTTGKLSSAATVTSTGTLVYNATNISKINAPVVNNGLVRWTAGDFDLQTGTFSNNSEFRIETTSGELVNSGNGTMINNSSGVINKTSSTIINSRLPLTNSGTLKGVGGIVFFTSFINNGKLAPGNSPGIIYINSVDNPLTPNSTLEIEVFANGVAGVAYDQLQRGQDLVLSGTLRIIETGAAAPGSFEIIRLTAGVLTGDFTNVIAPPGYFIQKTSTSLTATKTVALPVTLVKFEASKTSSSVDVSWTTSSELNMSHYEIERSADAIRFSSVGRIGALNNSSSTRQYSFTDHQPLNKTSYYRLRMVDVSGNSTYSSIARIVNEAKMQLHVYPNPTTGIIRLNNLPVGQKRIQLYTNNGQKLGDYTTSNQSATIDLTRFENGTYFIRVNDVVTPIIKQ